MLLDLDVIWSVIMHYVPQYAGTVTGFRESLHNACSIWSFMVDEG